jgi:hypothetical protein
MPPGPEWLNRETADARRDEASPRTTIICCNSTPFYPLVPAGPDWGNAFTLLSVLIILAA